MLAAMGVLALGCAGLALAPTALGPALSRAVSTATRTHPDVLGGGVSLHLAGIASTLSPLLIGVALAVSVAATAALVRLVTAPNALLTMTEYVPASLCVTFETVSLVVVEPEIFPPSVR